MEENIVRQQRMTPVRQPGSWTSFKKITDKLVYIPEIWHTLQADSFSLLSCSYIRLPGQHSVCNTPQLLHGSRSTKKIKLKSSQIQCTHSINRQSGHFNKPLRLQCEEIQQTSAKMWGDKTYPCYSVRRYNIPLPQCEEIQHTPATTWGDTTYLCVFDSHVL